MLKKAFTLIEILIVVILLGILAAVVVPQFADTADTARTNAAATTERMVQTQVELYRAKTGDYPADIATLVTDGYLEAEPDSTNFTVTYTAGTGDVVVAPIN